MATQQSHQQVLAQARQGDAPAIGLLIDQALTTRGIQVKAVRKAYCLHVLLESQQPPDRQTYARVVYAAVLCLGAASIRQLQVYGRQRGLLQPAWVQVFRMVEPDWVLSKPAATTSTTVADAVFDVAISNTASNTASDTAISDTASDTAISGAVSKIAISDTASNAASDTASNAAMASDPPQAIATFGWQGIELPQVPVWWSSLKVPTLKLSAVKIDRSLVLSLFAASLGLGAGLSLLRHFEGSELDADTGIDIMDGAVNRNNIDRNNIDRNSDANPPVAIPPVAIPPVAELPDSHSADNPAVARFKLDPQTTPVDQVNSAQPAIPHDGNQTAHQPIGESPTSIPLDSNLAAFPSPVRLPPVATPSIESASTPTRSPIPPSANLPDPTSATEVAVTLKAVGDMIPGSNYSGAASLPTEAGEALNAEREFLFGNIKPFLGEADLLFGNFESTLTTHPDSAKDTSQGMTFAFRTPPVYAQMLKELGFDVLSVANNHSMDFGEPGFADTIAHIEQAGMKAVGQKGQIVYTLANNVPIAFIGFSYLPDHNLMHDLEAGGALVREAKQKAKIVVISVHAGAEGSDQVHTRNETEYFFGEDRGNLVAFARGMIDQGADLVLGHGPHVPRALEVYQDKLIAYSLGNFVGYKTLSTVGALGDSLILTAQLNAAGDFVGGRIIPVALTADGVPRLDDYFRSVVLIRNLTQQDFPATPITIDDMGYIIRTDRSQDTRSQNAGN
ncbi:MAG: CapA family protein [Elainella sp. Prado103]|nr:CapA family protein [Elainella sp. Prado103]